MLTAGALGAGAVALSGCGGSASPAPTVKASTTAAATAAASASAAPSPTGDGGNVGATNGASGNPDDGTTPTPTTPSGTQLAAYSFDLTNAYGAPLGQSAPTRVQISAGTGDDVYYNGDITAGSGDQLLSLPAGSTPTFQACSSDTLIGGSQSAARGSAFCIVENGYMAGVTVTSVGTSTSGTNFIVLNVTLWQDTGVTATSSS